MKLDQGITKVYSWGGFVFTIILFAIITGYSGQKLDVLVNHGDIDILETTTTYFDNKFVFGAENNFNLAVAFTAFDNELEPILDPTYGELSFKAYEWGVENGTTFVRQDKIES